MHSILVFLFVGITSTYGFPKGPSQVNTNSTNAANATMAQTNSNSTAHFPLFGPDPSFGTCTEEMERECKKIENLRVLGNDGKNGVLKIQKLDATHKYIVAKHYDEKSFLSITPVGENTEHQVYKVAGENCSVMQLQSGVNSTVGIQVMDPTTRQTVLFEFQKISDSALHRNYRFAYAEKEYRVQCRHLFGTFAAASRKNCKIEYGSGSDVREYHQNAWRSIKYSKNAWTVEKEEPKVTLPCIIQHVVFALASSKFL